MNTSDKVNDLGNLLGTNVSLVEESVVSKAEKALLQSNSLDVEDRDIFQTISNTNGKGINYIKPTYEPVQLAVLTQRNNTLMQCVTAMEVNIDGTGYTIEPKDPEADADDTQIENIKQFFDEPYPETSFTSMRRSTRRDLESTGNGYLEVIRSEDGAITFIKHAEAKLTRMVKLGERVQTTQTVKRMGQEVSVQTMVRERSFVQVVGNKLVYFKEFGSSRKLDWKTGIWEGSALEGGETYVVRPEFEATELIHFTVSPDVLTNYGVPRWINQVPSVMGSRKAEELNLEFFNSGGIPPVMILVQGGALDPQARESLTSYLAGNAKYKNRGVLAEVFSTGGEIGGASGNVKVSVERFGSEKIQDSMFEKYDERCQGRVRTSFRLPPLFLGLAQDYNFATAQASYMVAEAQVFAPERNEFDEIINVKIMKEIAPEYVFRSKPLSIKDVESQLKALEMVKDSVEHDNFVGQLQEVSSLTLVPKSEDTMQEEKDKELELIQARFALRSADQGSTQEEGGEEVKKGIITNMSDQVLVDLAKDWADHINGVRIFEDASIKAMTNIMNTFEPPLRKMFNSYVAMDTMRSNEEAIRDLEGTAELLDCAANCLVDHDSDKK